MARPRRSEQLLTPPKVRMIKPDWDDYQAAHPDAAERIRQYIAWDLRRPGARLPDRPPSAAQIDRDAASRQQLRAITRKP